MTTPGGVADQFLADASDIDRELAEIDMLITQAKSETARHEARRAAAADKLAGLDASATAGEAVELAGQVVNLARRAALMDAQLEILEGKRRSAARLQDVLRAAATTVRGLEEAAAPTSGSADGAESDAAPPPVVSRLVLSAQEDLRREISRAMHDGPAQSLTNIVLQAEIVERLVARDPASAAAEVRALVAMVQQTLEATKTFIFDVRPMVLDDLGLVPTLRRSARDRGRRADLEVAFSSAGVDQRLGVDLETGVFRIVDEALAAYLAERPARASVTIDWSAALVIEVRAEPREAATPLEIPENADATSPTLSAMVADRREQHSAAVEKARAAVHVTIPPRLLRDLTQRAETLGFGLETLDEGAGLRLAVPLPGEDGPPS